MVLQKTWKQHSARPTDLDFYAANATLTLVPTGAGASSKAQLKAFLQTASRLEAFCPPEFPNDTIVQETFLKARYWAGLSVVEELSVYLVHDTELTWLLPDIKPTNKKLLFPCVVIATFDDEEKIVSKRYYWDQATILKQAGLFETPVPVVSAVENTNTLMQNLSIAPETVPVQQQPAPVLVQSPRKAYESLKRDSIGSMLSGEAGPESIRPSTKLNSFHIGGKSTLFESAELDKPKVHVDPRRFESHFTLSETDTSSVFKTTRVENTDDLHCQHLQRNPANNHSDVQIAHDGTPHLEHFKAHRRPGSEYHNKSHFQTSWESVESVNDAAIEQQKVDGDKKPVSIWASSSNGLGGIQSRPSSRVLNVPGGKSSFSLG